MARPRKHDPVGVLQSAMEVFWRKGFVATSMSDIYEATGLKPGNLYATFKDKDGLFRAAFAAYADQFRATLPLEAEGLAAIRAWLVVQVRLAVADPERRGCLIVNTAAEREAHSPETQALAKARLDEIRAFFRHHLGKAQASGELPAAFETEACADGLLGTVVAIMSLARSGVADGTIRNVGAQAWSQLEASASVASRTSVSATSHLFWAT